MSLFDDDPRESRASEAAYRVDGRLVDSARFYQVACDPRRSVVVEACAGAGKTWMLVSRILRALLDGAGPEQILAITFTRKAAGEMRERLQQWLREYASCDEDARRQALRDRGVSERELDSLSRRLAGLHEHILLGGRGVDIRTFHAWFSQLLRTAPLSLLQEIGLPPGAALIEDTAELAPELFRRFHAVVREDEHLRDDFVSLVRERGRASVRDWLQAAWNRRVEVESADGAGTLESSVPPAGALWPEFDGLTHPSHRLAAPRVHALFVGLAAELGTGHSTAQKQAGVLEQALSLDDLQRRWQGVCSALLTAKGEPRARLDAPSLPLALAHLQDIQRAVEQQQAHVDHVRMVRLARVLLSEYASLKRRRGLVDMADLERCALHLLRDATLAGWVQERLDQRVRHVLIDEFQDTSPLQWRALHGWLSSYAGAGGGASGVRAPSVFIVGDPKQSIYRFRNADPRVFQAARDFVQQALAGQVLECDHTRRNARGVIEAVNTVFGQAEAAGEYPGFRLHTTGAADRHGSVIALPRIARGDKTSGTRPSGWRDSLTTPRVETETSLRQREAAQAAAHIEAWIADGVRAGEIQVLARRRVVLAEVALALQALGIAHVAPEDLPLWESPEVRDLVAVLDVLASPSHDLSLAQALRSPLFGASDDDLHWLAQRASRGRWAAALQSAHDGPPALQRAARLLAGWTDALAHLPPHDLLDRIVHEGDVIARTVAAVPASRRQVAVQAVEALLSTSLQLDGGRYTSVYAFVRALKRRPVTFRAGAAGDAVQLLTVHGAKGLEARCVLLMDTDAPASSPETTTVLFDWPVDEEVPRRCAFLASESRCPDSLKALLLAEVEARRREELNGLYVAMTRARDLLAVSSIEPHRAAAASWWSRLSALAADVELPTRPAHPGGGEAASVEVPELPSWPGTGAREKQKTAQTASRTMGSAAVKANDELSRRGEALHKVLEWAANDREASLTTLVTQARGLFGLAPEHEAPLRDQAHAVLHGEETRVFFEPLRLSWAGNEVSVADGDDLLRLDRLVAMDGPAGRTWWVLDYKLQSDPLAVPAYVSQLERYRRVIQGLQPGEAVRAAFITAQGRLLEIEGSGV